MLSVCGRGIVSQLLASVAVPFLSVSMPPPRDLDLGLGSAQEPGGNGVFLDFHRCERGWGDTFHFIGLSDE